MKIDVLTLFPQIFASTFEESIIKRAQDRSLVKINIANIRDFAQNKHQQVDDYPYGEARYGHERDVLHRALDYYQTPASWLIYLSPQGQLLNQAKVRRVSP